MVLARASLDVSGYTTTDDEERWRGIYVLDGSGVAELASSTVVQSLGLSIPYGQGLRWGMGSAAPVMAPGLIHKQRPGVLAAAVPVRNDDSTAWGVLVSGQTWSFPRLHPLTLPSLSSQR